MNAEQHRPTTFAKLAENLSRFLTLRGIVKKIMIDLQAWRTLAVIENSETPVPPVKSDNLT